MRSRQDPVEIRVLDTVDHKGMYTVRRPMVIESSERRGIDVATKIYSPCTKTTYSHSSTAHAVVSAHIFIKHSYVTADVRMFYISSQLLRVRFFYITSQLLRMCFILLSFFF